MFVSFTMADQLDDLSFLKSVVSTGTVKEIQEVLKIVPADLLTDDQYIDYVLVLTALEKKRVDVVHVLVDNGFRVHRNYGYEARQTPLHFAVELGNLSLVNNMLNKGAFKDIGTQNKTGQTPVQVAIEADQTAIMQLFLLTADAVTLDNQYLVHYAVEKSKSDLVNLLLEKGCSVTKKNENDETPFCIAVKKNELTILDLLLSSYNFSLDTYANIALTYIASITGNIHFLKKSISTGFPIDRPIQSCPGDWSVLRNCAGSTLLCLAVEHVQLEAVKFLLRNGVNFTIKNGNNLSPFSLAVKAKTINIWDNQLQLEHNNKIIEEILRASVKSNIYESSEQKTFYFYAACTSDQPDILEYFLQNDSVNDSINLINSPRYGFSALHLAAKHGCRKNLELLLKYGGNVNQEGHHKMTPLHVASKETSIETVELLIKHGASVFNEDASGSTPVHYAFMTKQYAILDLLLTVQTIANSNPINARGISHFHMACTRNNINAVESLIKSGVNVNKCVPVDSKIKYSVYYNDTDWNGWSPLHFAVSFNKPKIVHLLLCNNANVEIKDARGFTPLHLACQYGQNKFGELIQNSLENIKSYRQSQEKRKSHRNIESNPKSTMRKNSKFMKIIDWSVNRKEQIKVINLLIKYKSNVNCLDNFGHGPLFYTFYFNVNRIVNTVHGQVALQTVFKDKISLSLFKELNTRRNLILNILFQTNVNPDICYKRSSILHYICSRSVIPDEQKVELAKLFLQHGVDVNAKNESAQTPLHSAVKVMDEKLVKLLLNYNADVDSIDSKKRSPLHVATSHDLCAQSAKIIKLLVQKSPNVNLKQIDGKTALHNLVSQSLSNYSDFETIHSLIKIGADVNSQDLNGKTPLFMACSQENEAVSTLIDFGADINIEDCHGNNVLHYIYHNQAKPLYMRRELLGDNLLSMLETLYNHLIKLTTVGLHVSENILLIRSKLRVILKRNLFEYLDKDEQHKISECTKEVEMMKTIRIGSKHSLYDIMFKDDSAMTKCIKNDTLINIIQSRNLAKMFPVYGNFLELKYIEDIKRCVCMPYAKFSLIVLFGLHLPELCSEKILGYLNYCELKEFLESMYLVICEKKPSKSHMPLRVRTSNTKYRRVN